jgi:hypothetical protein
MGTTLTGTTPQDTYDSLIKVTDNGPLSGTAKYLSDGLGNDSVLALSTARVGLGTNVPSAMLTLNATEPFIRIERSGVPTWQIQNNTLSVDAGFSINNLTNAGTPFFINGTTNNVGIGTGSPAVPLDVVGNIRSSTGILFGSDTAAANALDDYEEGTWTMGVSFGNAAVGVTYTSTTGTYTKIGRQVTVSGYLVLSNKGSSTGSARITGLPFTISNATGNYSAASLWFNGVSFVNQYSGISQVNTTNIELFETTLLGALTTITDADFANNSEVIVGFTYFV